MIKTLSQTQIILLRTKKTRKNLRLILVMGLHTLEEKSMENRQHINIILGIAEDRVNNKRKVNTFYLHVWTSSVKAIMKAKI